MSDLLSGIKFVSKTDIDERKRISKEAKERQIMEARAAAHERKIAAKAAAASGESNWLAPALDAYIGHDSVTRPGGEDSKEHKEHKHKHKQRHKHKHKQTHHDRKKHHKRDDTPNANGSDNQSESSESGHSHADGSGPVASSPKADPIYGPNVDHSIDGRPSRSSAGLDWMLRAPARPPGNDSGAVLSGDLGRAHGSDEDQLRGSGTKQPHHKSSQPHGDESHANTW